MEKILRLAAFQVSFAKGQLTHDSNTNSVKMFVKIILSLAKRIVEILVDATESSNVSKEEEELVVFAWTAIWEVLFVREDMATSLLSYDDGENTSRNLWASLKTSNERIQSVALFSAARILLYQEAITSFSVQLLLSLVEAYTTPHQTQSSEKQNLAQMLYGFFEEEYGDSEAHQTVVKCGLLKINHEAYLDGVPLPSTSASLSQIASQSQFYSQSLFYSKERQLRLQNRFLVSKLQEPMKQQLYAELQAVFLKEFSMKYSVSRMAEILSGAL